METTQNAPAAASSSPFASNAWSESTPTPEAAVANNDQQPTTAEVASGSAATTEGATQAAQQPSEPTVPVEWLKKEFEVEDAETLKQQIQEYKKLKEAPPTQEIKYENDESKRLHEAIAKGDRKTVLKILADQDKVERLSSLEVNETTAADIVKAAMQLKFKDLTESEVDYKFNKQFAVPAKPVQGVDELDDTYAERLASWESAVNDKKMELLIEAKTLRPEIEAYKQKIVLPEIATQPEQPSQELLEKQAKARELFLKTLNSEYTKVNGFETRVKDESVDIPIEFKIPDDVKGALKSELEKGFDLNGYFDKRWFSEDGTPNVAQIIKDRYVLDNLDKILSGVATKSANERLQHYQREVKNINLNNGSSQETFQPAQTNGQQGVSPFSKNAWSESVPQSVN